LNASYLCAVALTLALIVFATSAVAPWFFSRLFGLYKGVNIMLRQLRFEGASICVEIPDTGHKIVLSRPDGSTTGLVVSLMNGEFLTQSFTADIGANNEYFWRTSYPPCDMVSRLQNRAALMSICLAGKTLAITSINHSDGVYVIEVLFA
jgi:hypothetical protein